MSAQPDRTREPGPTPAIAAYKTILRDVLERRPSGTRQRLAQALEKARSFVSQIANPTYPVAIPAQHLSTIFEVCHFSALERQGFLAAYAAAHPRRLVALAAGPRHRTIHVVVPDLGDEARNREFQHMVQDFATRLARFSRAAPLPRPLPEKAP